MFQNEINGIDAETGYRKQERMTIESIFQKVRETGLEVFGTAKFAEFWGSLIVLAWGSHLVVIGRSPNYDIVSSYLTSILPFTLQCTGYLLLLTGVIHLFNLPQRTRTAWIARWLCLLAEFCFFLFCWIALAKGKANLTEVSILPTYWLVMAIRNVWICFNPER